MNFRVLISWSEAEKRQIFVSFLADQETIDKLCKFNNKYIASCDENLQKEMNAFFYEKGNFKFSKIEGPLINHRYDLIINCGN